MGQKWEYKVVQIEANGKGFGTQVNPSPESALNEAAEDGWELMNVVAYPSGERSIVSHYFRREAQKPNASSPKPGAVLVANRQPSKIPGSLPRTPGSFL